ncbi:MAG: alpha/beta hydrolase [Deltaproteobacteria bacterium HGW-Deltaproteobacteria-13]|nr:MAG: alpha/beta hydrolase [Deltaproteobacteria bacterium HGW-Deltaproteobacteria-13]
MQNKFLYFPEPQWPTAQALEYEKMKLWQSTDKDYQGLISSHDAVAPNGTIVLFHGNGGTALDRGFYFAPFEELGFRVILAEYPKYGGRPGKVGEKPFVFAGSQTLRLAFEQFGEPLYLVGESLGCGVAATVAKQTSVPIAGIILITPWDTLASVAKSLFPFLPVKLVLTDKYDSIENLQSFKNKISVVGAERDEILPIKHAVNLYNALPEGKKRMWIIKGAGHNDWPMHADPSLFKEITDFVKIDKN